MSEFSGEYAGQRAVFNDIAGDYDRFRPTYPEELAEDVVAYSSVNSGSHALEIGSGTGKGTEMFAHYGFSIHCLEPGANLAEIARSKFVETPGVDFENLTFEAWDLKADAYDLIYSAQAFHWIPAEMGLRKAADALKIGGAVALFWNTRNAAPYTAYDEIQEIYAREAPELYKEARESVSDWSLGRRTDQLHATGRYADVELKQYEWIASYSADHYIKLLDTHSSHQMLPEAQKERLYPAIHEVVQKHGGEMKHPYNTVLYLGRRAN